MAKGEKKVVIGRDGRLSGPVLAAALAEGLQAAGVDVIDLGVVATPMVSLTDSSSVGGAFVASSTTAPMPAGPGFPRDPPSQKMRIVRRTGPSPGNGSSLTSSGSASPACARRPPTRARSRTRRRPLRPPAAT